MKAALFSYDKGLRIVEYELDKLGSSQVLVKIKAAGLCASDLHYMNGRYRYSKEPIIPGHEGSGVVEEVGSEVSGIEVGDEVIIDYVWSCGRCEYCLTGKGNLCKYVKCYGFELDGTFGEYIIVDSMNVVPKPKGLSFEESAIIGCAVVTPYHAIKNVGGVSNKIVAVVGLGGVGIHTVLLSKLMGARMVIGLDIDDRKCRIAEDYGLDYFINPIEDNVTREVERLTKEGVDVAFEFVGSPKSIETAINITRPGGTTLIGGLVHGRVNINLEAMLSLEKRILTTMDHNHMDLIEVTRFIEERGIRLNKSISRKFNLENIKEAIRLFNERGEPIVRIIITP